MNEPPHTNSVQPCLCYIIGKHDVCPVHGLDRAQTTERDKKPERVVNTTETLRKS